MLFRLDIAALCLNRKVISRLVSSFHPVAKLMSRPCHDGWPLSGSSRVIDFYGNSSECNQTSETLNTHVRAHTVLYTDRPCRLKGRNCKCQNDKCQPRGLGGFTSGIQARDPRLNFPFAFLSFISLFYSSSFAYFLSSSLLFFFSCRRFWEDHMPQSRDLTASFSRSSAIRISPCQQELTRG